MSENSNSYFRRLHWVAGGLDSEGCWRATNEQMSVTVSTMVYQEHLRAFLTERGIEMKTYSEYMRPAEDAWQRQCEAENAFQADLDYWKTHQVRGVRIRLVSEPQQKEQRV